MDVRKAIFNAIAKLNFNFFTMLNDGKENLKPLN
jgi:hypothetical protein